MRVAIPSTRLCYWSLCNDLPKDPDFLATACHKNIWQEFNILSLSLFLSVCLFLRNGSVASLLCVCHQPRCCC